MSDSSIDLLNIDVGDRLRELRQERSLSMRAVARASGISANALSMIERGRASPSVSTLYKIAESLNVPITAFFRAEPIQQEIVAIKVGDRKRVALHQGIWEGLGGESFIGRMEPFILSLDPGSGSGPFGMLHSGSEFVHCLEGEIVYTVEDKLYHLNPGDSLIFAAHLQHRWVNQTEKLAKVLIVLANFEASERPMEYHLSSNFDTDLELDHYEEDHED